MLLNVIECYLMLLNVIECYFNVILMLF